MPEEIEIETKELQEAIDELHEERDREREREKSQEWTRYIGLSTAIFAVFAAIGALEAGAFVNEAMISQLKASDTWNEYQAAKLKVHMYGIQVDDLKVRSGDKGLLEKYQATLEKENKKTEELQPEAKKLEQESEHLMHRHHQFSRAVTGIQVAIALGAVAALTRGKLIWIVGMVIGLGALALFALGFAS